MAAARCAVNGSQFLDESALFPGKASVEQGGAVTLNDEPGIGVEPDEQGLARLCVEP